MNVEQAQTPDSPPPEEAATAAAEPTTVAEAASSSGKSTSSSSSSPDDGASPPPARDEESSPPSSSSSDGSRNDAPLAAPQTTLWQGLKSHLLRPGKEHVEVTARLGLCALAAMCLALISDIPTNVVPDSQRGTIAFLAPPFAMIMPTLIFSIGAGILPLVVSVAVSITLATMLLAIAAAGGKGAFAGVYGVVALILGGMKWDKGGSGQVALVLVTLSTSTMSLVDPAVEGGLDYVRSLWGAGASFPLMLLGYTWAAVCMMFGRVLPPFRTARTMISKGLAPKVIKDASDMIDFAVDRKSRVNGGGKDGGTGKGGGAEEEEVAGEGKDAGNGGKTQSAADGDAADADDDVEKERKLFVGLIGDGSVTSGGGIAPLTAFEPRIFRCACPPECSFVALTKLLIAIDHCLNAALSLNVFTREGIWEARRDALNEEHRRSAATLKRCAGALVKLELIEDNSDGKKEEGDEEEAKTQLYDPIALGMLSGKLVDATNDWVREMLPPQRGAEPKMSYRDAVAKSCVPWLKALFAALTGLFMSAYTVFKPETWRRVVRPPHQDLPFLVWTVKFAVGYTALICMGVFWPAFSDLEVPVRNPGTGVGTHFAGWYLIAFGFATTQTLEGTYGKGLLRACGVCGGALSAYLALLASEKNVAGLIAWCTITTVVAAYLGVPRGAKARMGLNKDFAWGPAYFVMNQNLLVTYSYWYTESKESLITNRVIANLVGISMALVVAIIPPAQWGGDPRHVRDLLSTQRDALRSCIELIRNAADGGGGEEELEKARKELDGLIESSKAAFKAKWDRANDYATDANMLSRLPIMNVDPNLLKEIKGAAILSSQTLVVLLIGQKLLQDASFLVRLKDGTEQSRDMLTVLEGLTGNEDGAYYEPAVALRDYPDGDSAVVDSSCPRADAFVHRVVVSYRFMRRRDRMLSEIKWGYFGHSCRAAPEATP